MSYYTSLYEYKNTENTSDFSQNNYIQSDGLHCSIIIIYALTRYIKTIKQEPVLYLFIYLFIYLKLNQKR